jgi:hypothetical protein
MAEAALLRIGGCLKSAQSNKTLSHSSTVIGFVGKVNLTLFRISSARVEILWG